MLGFFSVFILILSVLICTVHGRGQWVCFKPLFITKSWMDRSKLVVPDCRFDSSPESVDTLVYDLIGFKNKTDLWWLLLQSLENMKMRVCIKTKLLVQWSANIHASFSKFYQPHPQSDVTMSLWRQIITSKSLDQKKRKWKHSRRTDTLVKSKYLIIFLFFLKGNSQIAWNNVAN